MATNQQVIDRALYELGYIEYGASADATDAGDALNALNDLMHEWRIRDIDLNWFTQDTLGDTAPIPTFALSGVISNLAVRLGAVFNVSVPPETYNKATEGRRAIHTAILNVELEGGQDMSHMNAGEAHQRWDIETDS